MLVLTVDWGLSLLLAWRLRLGLCSRSIRLLLGVLLWVLLRLLMGLSLGLLLWRRLSRGGSLGKLILLSAVWLLRWRGLDDLGYW